MTVLITGGLGTNGSWVLRELVQQGERPVCFGHASDTSRVTDLINRFVLIEGEIQDRDALSKVFKENGVGSVVHTAAVMGAQVRSPDRKLADPVAAFEVNCKGTLNVLEAARLTNVDKIVFNSAKAVYGEISGVHGPPTYKPVKESHPKNPQNLYGVTKLFGEQMGELYSELYGIEFTSLRFAGIYGPGKLKRNKPTYSTRDLIISNAAKGIPTQLTHDIVDDMIYVKDVAKSIMLALRSRKLPNKAYNIGMGRVFSLTDVINAVKMIIPKAEIEMAQAISSSHETPLTHTRCAMDWTRAKKELGFESEFDLNSGVRDYIEWLKQSGE